MFKNCLLISVFFISICNTAAFADNCRQSSASLSQYVNCKIPALAAGGAALEAQQTDLSKQSEANSAATNSTTLVDRSAGPDFVASSLAFPGLASKSSVPNSTDYSVAVSLYAVYSLLRTTNPFDLHFYDSTSAWRKFSFNFVDSYPSEKASTISQGSRTYGATFLLHGSRDIGDPSNQDKLASLNMQIGAASGDFGIAYHQIVDYLFKYSAQKDRRKFTDTMENEDFFRSVMSRLSSEDERQIEEILKKYIESQVALMTAIRRVAEEIKKSPQLSTIFTSRISKGTSSNLYRFGLAYDRGIVGQLNSTTNLSYDFMNAQLSRTRNRNILRLVEQVQYVALSTHSIPKRNITVLTGSGEGDWGSNGAPVYKANVKITLSAMAGIDVPLSFTYTSLIPSTGKSDVKFQAALAFDISKISRAVAH
jgi:hypothetical protein